MDTAAWIILVIAVVVAIALIVMAVMGNRRRSAERAERQRREAEERRRQARLHAAEADEMAAQADARAASARREAAIAERESAQAEEIRAKAQEARAEASRLDPREEERAGVASRNRGRDRSDAEREDVIDLDDEAIEARRRGARHEGPLRRTPETDMGRIDEGAAVPDDPRTLDEARMRDID